jgi:predicted O-methyltransferase YrrM
LRTTIIFLANLATKIALFHSAQSYLRFLVESTNQYGVHSPFVYDFLTVGLKEKIGDADRDTLRKLRKALEADQSRVMVEDFGAGSRKFKDSERKVSQIAKTAGISWSRSRKLYRTVKHFKPQNILEFGTSLGMATASMSLATPEAKIDTLEGCPQTAGIAISMFDRFGMQNINMHIGEFSSTLPGLLNKNSYDLVFFDGNHQKEATLSYFEMCLESAHDSSVFIFDDIHWSQDMEQAWKEIREHDQVTLSIDTYQWGFVFFKSGRQKEHFILRI